jgi:hypothetical protein
MQCQNVAVIGQNIVLFCHVTPVLDDFGLEQKKNGYLGGKNFGLEHFFIAKTAKNYNKC